MFEFDAYISNIVGALRIGKKKKEELADEFKDHLNSLKTEFVQNGFTEEESIQKAIECFGKTYDIQKKLQKSLANLRNPGSILFGATLVLIIVAFGYLPMYGYTIAFHHYGSGSAHTVSSLLASYGWHIENILLFLPVGYFAPVIFNRVFHPIKYALAFTVLGLLTGAGMSIALVNYIDTAYLLSYAASGLLGGMAGYALLTALNKLQTILKKNKAPNTIKS
jgi:hypothetical protein